jgi:hypothetical protein
VKEIYDFGSAISADFDKIANNNHIFTFYSFHWIFAHNGIRKSEKLKELFFANARQKLKMKRKKTEIKKTNV